MAKRISETDRLLKFALNASEEGLATAIDTLKAVQDNRFTQKTPKTPRAPRKTKEKEQPDNKAAVASGD